MNIIKKSMNTTIFKPNNNDDSIIALSSKDKKKLEFLAREQMKLDKLNQKKDSKVRKGGKINEPNNLLESVFMNNIDSTPIIKPNSVDDPESDSGSESDSDSDDESNNKNKNKNKSKFDTADDSDSDDESNNKNKNKSKFDPDSDSSDDDDNDSDDESNVKTNNKSKFDPDDDSSDDDNDSDKPDKSDDEDKDKSCNLPTSNQVDKKTNKYSLSDSDFDSDSDDESNSKFKSKSKSNCKSNSKSNLTKDTVSKKRNLIKTVNHTKTQKALKNEQKLKNDLVEINNITNNVTNNVEIDTNHQIDNDFEVNIKLQARSARKKICIITGIPNRFFADKEKNKDFIATMRATCATSVTLKEEKLDTDENISEYIIIIAGNKVDNVKSIICKFCNCPESNLKIHNLK